MVILIGALVFAGVALVAYGLLLGGDKGSKKKARISDYAKLPELDSKGESILKLQEEMASLSNALQESKQDFDKARLELAVAIAEKKDLNERLAKRQEWTERSDEDLSKAREKSFEVINKLKDKEKELLEAFNKNEELKRERMLLEDKIKLSEDENKRISKDNLRLKFKIERLTQESKAHADTASVLKKKQQESEWVSKKDFERLNEEYTQLESELELIEKQLQSVNTERVKLMEKLRDSTVQEKKQQAVVQDSVEVVSKEQVPAKEEIKKEVPPEKEEPKQPEPVVEEKKEEAKE
ncbi:MAG: hypothetical protein ABIE81_07515, partial [Candidatus Omnitrophota bacterium]